MYIAGITKSDIANGPGVRLSVFVSGCTNRCSGCFQPETWDFTYGKEYDRKTEDEILLELSKPYYRGITLLGGDPYTGFVYDKDLVPEGKRYYDGITDKLLNNINVLVDGPFIEEVKDIRLKFRGSSNQRIIDLTKTRKEGSVILWEQ